MTSSFDEPVFETSVYVGIIILTLFFCCLSASIILFVHVIARLLSGKREEELVVFDDALAARIHLSKDDCVTGTKKDGLTSSDDQTTSTLVSKSKVNSSPSVGDIGFSSSRKLAFSSAVPIENPECIRAQMMMALRAIYRERRSFPKKWPIRLGDSRYEALFPSPLRTWSNRCEKSGTVVIYPFAIKPRVRRPRPTPLGRLITSPSRSFGVDLTDSAHLDTSVQAVVVDRNSGQNNPTFSPRLPSAAVSNDRLSKSPCSAETADLAATGDVVKNNSRLDTDGEALIVTQDGLPNVEYGVVADAQKDERVVTEMNVVKVKPTAITHSIAPGDGLGQGSVGIEIQRHGDVITQMDVIKTKKGSLKNTMNMTMRDPLELVTEDDEKENIPARVIAFGTKLTLTHDKTKNHDVDGITKLPLPHFTIPLATKGFSRTAMNSFSPRRIADKAASSSSTLKVPLRRSTRLALKVQSNEAVSTTMGTSGSHSRFQAPNSSTLKAPEAQVSVKGRGSSTATASRPKSCVSVRSNKAALEAIGSSRNVEHVKGSNRSAMKDPEAQGSVKGTGKLTTTAYRPKSRVAHFKASNISAVKGPEAQVFVKGKGSSTATGSRPKSRVSVRLIGTAPDTIGTSRIVAHAKASNSSVVKRPDAQAQVSVKGKGSSTATGSLPKSRVVVTTTRTVELRLARLKNTPQTSNGKRWR